jgi:hypothetical protein
MFEIKALIRPQRLEAVRMRRSVRMACVNTATLINEL